MDNRNTKLNDLNLSYGVSNPARSQASSLAVVERPTVDRSIATRNARNIGSSLAQFPSGEEAQLVDTQVVNNASSLMGHVHKATNDAIKTISDAGASLGNLTKQAFSTDDKVRDTGNSSNYTII